VHFFIDEAGTFQSKSTSGPAVSCVGVVTVPSQLLDQFEDVVARLTRDWPRTETGELKGRLLGEEHIEALCIALVPLQVLLEVAVADLTGCPEADIKAHQADQAARLTVSLTERHHPNLVQQVWQLRWAMEGLAPQLYVQSLALTGVIWRALGHGQLYFCQRRAGELSRFVWRIDAKEEGKITAYEDLWVKTLFPFLQSTSLREPLIQLRGGDYSAYRRNFPKIPVPEYLREQHGGPIKEPFGHDLRAVFRDMEFQASHRSMGLQVADVLTNAVRRALTGRLRREGWEPLQLLMIHTAAGAIRPQTLKNDGGVVSGYAHVIRRLNAGGRDMLTPSRRR